MPLKKSILLSVFIISCFFIACTKDPLITTGFEERVPKLPSSPYNYESDSFPSYFLSGPPLSFLNSIQANNPITNEGATLGRVLFYDTQLSANNSISCGSCHSQAKAFSDPNSFSRGFNGGLTNRNSMAIINSRFSFRYFWDNRAELLEQQVLMPIQNHIEMGMELNDLETRLREIDYYKPLFKNAFGDEEISSARISKALTQFVHTLISYTSKYDIGFQNSYSNFTPEETDGKNLFFSGTINCNHCHSTQNFYGNQMLNNGLDSIYADNGSGGLSGNPADNGKFKVPTLRNIELTAPYMHDGRFATLEEVVEHYNSGLRQHPNLDDRLAANGLTGGPPKQYNMTAYQKASLIAFLKTLTDQQFVQDIRFSDPFQ
ncbi:MAG: cytochrome-c peroxidase [Bacteroidota bacterium]|nr:cytochrome-c peroxidase [Bacteroidota bacterium]